MAAAMAEEQEGVNYASVVFKANKHPPSEGKTEETVYDEVKVQNGTTDQAADAGFLEDKRANNRRRHFKRLACGLGIISVILLAGIIAVCVYTATLSHENERLEEIQKNHLTNLTNRINELSSENENLMRDNDNLTVQMSNLTQNYTVLENKITNLTKENLNLTTQNQELKSQKNILTEQIQEMKANNVSRAQWSIDAYCPKKNDERQCAACQDGWKHKKSSCYVIHNGGDDERITWEKALKNCTGKNSDLAVIHDEEEKKVINDYSWDSSGTDGYWIGLRVKDGKWKWIDGSDLAKSSWIDPPAEGRCAISVKNKGWKSVRCDKKQRWICRRKALSV
ncbi:C-type lectin domain family 10 member A isoform X15 [Epinephelus fuscoguttatus]|uniref:C-type lectin domain family 10 member A isoform X13 n=1 Tax=Epinephelus fuscoguttatus TaxID=293821 RepID=UPI0020D039C0|nr:C-type lectin domain family 10 member A isoform X13 [Epinephelus fuscoguttatus]XP_049438751.1 C-type lectin domain family 10 member A isoform X14 [Epinephelus fuscoguttatus]XP_049438752.1 C-type lectin domain family 10 member A isoform X15 [Epinephelus fuscoguttatus]